MACSGAVELDVATITEAVAAAQPDRECLVFRDRRFTWWEVRDRTRRFAAVLHGAGLGIHGTFGSVPRWESVHDHVALYLHNGNEYLEGMLGAWKARCAPFNVNYRYVAEELGHLFDDARAAAVVLHHRFLPTFTQVLPRLRRPPLLVLVVADETLPHGVAVAESDALGHLRTVTGPATKVVDYECALASADPDLPKDLVDGWCGDDLYLCYTGGTTGLPKGAMWRQADFLVAALGVRRADGSEWDAVEELVERARGTVRALPAPPLMHGAAHWNALSCWVAGGTVIIQDHPSHLDADDVLDAAERHGATSVLVVGDPVARPLADALRSRPRRLPALRHVLSGGAVLSPGLKAELLELLPGVTVVDVLGSTESGRQGVATSSERSRADVGFSASPTAVVLDEDRRSVLPTSDRSVGWLAQGGRVPLGYLGDESKTRATFPEVEGSRLAVAGDRARWRPDGTLELLGRDSVCINTGGEKVFAEEVETALRTHPDVFDAVVCGRPSQRWGEEVVALVQLRDGRTPSDAELLVAAGEHIARFKLPKEVLRLPSILRSPSGKADYRWARSVAERSTGATP